MAAEENLTEVLVKAQTIDFVNRFGQQVKDLKEMLGIERTLDMPIGSIINTYTSKVTLADGNVAKGDIIPLSKVELTAGAPVELKFSKHRKAVAAEDVQKYGFEGAINRTDNELLKELQKDLRAQFFTQLAAGQGTASGVGLQGALAQAWGGVQTAFEDDSVGTIAFVNPLDIADYLAKAQITVQTAFGMKYVENFMGVDVVIISTRVTAKTVYATAPENLVFAFATMSGELKKMIPDLYTDNTGVIGVTRDVDRTRLTAETTTVSATVLLAENTAGVIKSTIQDAPVAP